MDADYKLVTNYLIGKDTVTGSLKKIQSSLMSIQALSDKGFINPGESAQVFEAFTRVFPELESQIKSISASSKGLVNNLTNVATVNDALQSSFNARGDFSTGFEKYVSTATQAVGKTTTMDKVVQKTTTSLENLYKVTARTDLFGALGLDNVKQKTQPVITSFDEISRGLDKDIKSAGKFDARLLSLLFSGMALQRAFGGFLKSITTTFLKAEDNTSDLGIATTKLNAAWEFLKFSIFDALNTDLFVGFIDGVVTLLNTFSQMPGLLTTVLFGSAGLYAIGGALLTIAQVTLAWNAILGEGGLLTSSTKVINGLDKISSAASKIAGAGILIVAAIQFKNNLTGEEGPSAGDIIINGITAGLGAALTFNAAAGIITGLTIVAALSIKKASSSLDQDINARAILGNISGRQQDLFENSGLDLRAEAAAHLVDQYAIMSEQLVILNEDLVNLKKTKGSTTEEQNALADTIIQYNKERDSILEIGSKFGDVFLQKLNAYNREETLIINLKETSRIASNEKLDQLRDEILLREENIKLIASEQEALKKATDDTTNYKNSLFDFNIRVASSITKDD